MVHPLGASEPVEAELIRHYDFAKPDRFSDDQLETLSSISDSIASEFTDAARGRFGTICAATSVSSRTCEYSEYVRAFAPLEFLAIASFQPIKGNIQLRFSPTLADAMLERAFGGRIDPGAARKEAWRLTDIERGELLRISAIAAKAIERSWFVLPSLRVEAFELDYDSAKSRIVPPTEMIFVSTISVSIDGIEGGIDVIYPFLTLEPVAKRLGASYWYSGKRRDGEPSREAAKRIVLDAELAVKGPSMTVAALRNLAPGASLELGRRSGLAAWLRLGGERIARLEGITRDECGWIARSATPAETKAEASFESLSRELNATKASLERGMREVAERLDAIASEREALLDRVEFGAADETSLARNAFSAISNADCESIASVLFDERDQLIALVACHLDEAKSARILEALGSCRAANVVTKVASIASVPAETLADIETALAAAMSRRVGMRLESGGMGKAAAILAACKADAERAALAELESVDPRLAGALRNNIVRFSDLALLAALPIGALEAIGPHDVAAAMRIMKDDDRNAVRGALDAEGRAKLDAAIASIGDIGLIEAEAAAARVASALRYLLEAGRLELR
jgi:flagellar motor switch protein FliM